MDTTLSHCSSKKQGIKEGRASASNVKVKRGGIDPVAIE